MVFVSVTVVNDSTLKNSLPKLTTIAKIATVQRTLSRASTVATTPFAWTPKAALESIRVGRPLRFPARAPTATTIADENVPRAIATTPCEKEIPSEFAYQASAIGSTEPVIPSQAQNCEEEWLRRDAFGADSSATSSIISSGSSKRNERLLSAGAKPGTGANAVAREVEFKFSSSIAVSSSSAPTTVSAASRRSKSSRSEPLDKSVSETVA
ncbi:unannotated protein [freshwater metagenome]|uniref:Unannotated protein n=1 Tax=freshwater metagenome TaxID=449393 RepID=A0A6J6JWJ7_9ZZZZ